MTKQLKGVFLAVAAAGLMLPAFGQTSSSQPAADPAKPATINQRKETQQDRIATGVQSGLVPAGETANLEKKEATVNGEERDMRKQDTGHLTAADRKTLNQQQNQLSKQIYKDKH